MILVSLIQEQWRTYVWYFRGIFWEVLWTLKLTQSQVGIVGWKIVNSLNRINRCIKFRKRDRLLVSFVVFFTALWTFWHQILSLSFILKNLYTFRTNIFSRSYRIIKGLAPTVIRIWLCFGQRSRFFARFWCNIYICFALSALVISFTPKFYFSNLKKKECSFRLDKPWCSKPCTYALF